MIISSRKSCIQLGSWARIPGMPPATVVPTGLCLAVASSSAAVRMNEPTPPQMRAWRIALGICRPASFVSSAMSPQDSKP